MDALAEFDSFVVKQEKISQVTFNTDESFLLNEICSDALPKK